MVVKRSLLGLYSSLAGLGNYIGLEGIFIPDEPLWATDSSCYEPLWATDSSHLDSTCTLVAHSHIYLPFRTDEFPIRRPKRQIYLRHPIMVQVPLCHDRP